MESGKVLVEKAIAVRHKVAELGVQFIKDDAVSCTVIYVNLAVCYVYVSETLINIIFLGNTYSFILTRCYAIAAACSSV